MPSPAPCPQSPSVCAKFSHMNWVCSSARLCRCRLLCTGVTNLNVATQSCSAVVKHSPDLPSLQEHSVDAYMSGHDHNLQVIRKVSAAGGGMVQSQHSRTTCPQLMVPAAAGDPLPENRTRRHRVGRMRTLRLSKGRAPARASQPGVASPAPQFFARTGKAPAGACSQVPPALPLTSRPRRATSGCAPPCQQLLLPSAARPPSLPCLPCSSRCRAVLPQPTPPCSKSSAARDPRSAPTPYHGWVDASEQASSDRTGLLWSKIRTDALSRVHA